MKTCPTCDGTGWKIVERGGVSGAAPCECQLATRVQAMLDHSGIPQNYAGCSFDNFRLPSVAEQVNFVGFAEALLYLKAYVKDFSRKMDPPGVLILGPHGAGKTHLAVAALRGVIGHGNAGVFLDCGNLIEQIKQSFGAKDGGRAEAYRQAMDSEVVLLDDLGEQANSEWVRDTISAVITHRCNHRKTTLATTALHPEDLARIGEGPASRLREMCKFVQLPLGAEDYRKSNPVSRRRKGT